MRAEWKQNSLLRAIEKYEDAESYYSIAHSENQQAEVLQRLGDVSCILSRYEKGIEFYKKALSLTENITSSRVKVDLLNRLANAYLETAQLKDALPYSQQAQV